MVWDSLRGKAVLFGGLETDAATATGTGNAKEARKAGTTGRRPRIPGFLASLEVLWLQAFATGRRYRMGRTRIIS
jgi:hypothetical protein